MPAPRKPVTIRDVSQAAGVSPATASRVLSRTGYPVSPELRERVLAAARACDYQPEKRERRVVRPSASREEIAVLLPDLDNPFYTQAIRGIEQVAEERGFGVRIFHTYGDPEREIGYLRRLNRSGVRAAILSPSLTDGAHLRVMMERGLNLVLLDQILPDLDCPSINFNVREGAQMATAHLIHHGHRKIALATTPPVRWSRRQVRLGYEDALRHAGIELDEHLIVTAQAGDQRSHQNQTDLVAGRNLGARLAEILPDLTAVLAVNDIVACGILQDWRTRGIRVPEDCSLVGLDDIPTAVMLSPGLTTIGFPTYEAGRLAAGMAVDAIDGHSHNPVRLRLEPHLVQRESVAAPRAGDGLN